MTGFLYSVASLSEIHQLAQVLDGVDVVVRGRGDGVRALGNHTGAGRRPPTTFCAGQMAADAGLRALAHLDLDGRAGFQIVLVTRRSGRRPPARWCAGRTGKSPHAGRPRRYYNRCPAAQAARARRLVGVVADGAVAHRREHDRHLQLELRRSCSGRGCRPASRSILLGFLPRKTSRFHRLAQRIDGGVGDLRSVDEDLVPVDRIRSSGCPSRRAARRPSLPDGRPRRWPCRSSLRFP